MNEMDNYTRRKIIEIEKKIDFLIKREFDKMKESDEISEDVSYDVWNGENFKKYKTTEESPYNSAGFSRFNNR